jgi:hypothetical protein
VTGGYEQDKFETSGITDEVLSSFFEAVTAAYQQAQQASGERIDRAYLIAGVPIRLFFAGRGLVPKIAPALEHLLVDETQLPSLTIYLWDSASTDIQIPAITGALSQVIGGREFWARNSNRFRFFYQSDAEILSLLDLERGIAFFWTRDAAHLPYYESGAPLRTILHWWMARLGVQFLHAGVVGTENGGVLLVGKGGSGKSTTAMACLNSGMLYAGDDYCLVSDFSAPIAHSIYCSGKLNAEDVCRFPDFQPSLSNQAQLATEKALYFFRNQFPQRILKTLPIRAVLIPELYSGQETSYAEVSSAAGFLALAPSTIFQLRDKQHPSHEMIGELLRNVPSYRLKVGPIGTVSPIIRSLLSKLQHL